MKPKGSAVVETVIATGLAGSLLIASDAMGRLALAQIRSVSVARYAAQLAAAGLEPTVIETESRELAEAVGLTAAVSTRRFLDLPSAAFYRLMAADVDVRVDRPVALGGGQWTLSRTAVLEEE